ncbi:hypothetical protein ACFOYW_09815 [Gryllotalpicola reticulitermitis]|uniref:Nuclear transport factor 2 family protein n=1 Tax=Gryllotalpicola reticulitermitis TaxID=1184153 RepID=A0ABV8Q907_9MICO
MSSISQALHELLNDADASVDEVLSRHFTDDYRQSTNGEWVDRAGFAQQMTYLRSVTDGAEIEVVAELVQGASYAERHIIRVTQRDGVIAAQEAYLFAQLAADGRFSSLEELTRPLAD